MSRILFFTLTITLLSTAGFAAESPDDRSSGGGSPRRRMQQVEDGYVFIDGKYLSPPYEVADTDQGVTINGNLITVPVPSAFGPGRMGQSGSRDRKSEFASSMNRHPADSNPTKRDSANGRSTTSNSIDDRRNGFASGQSPQSRVMHRLRSDSMLLFFENDLVIIDPRHVIHFLRIMKNFDVRSEPYQALMGSLVEEKDQELLSAWLKTYRPSEDLLQRANRIVEAYDSVDTFNREQNIAARRIDTFSYPITVFGMVLAVLSSGHLLNSRPANTPDGASAGCQPTVLRAAMVSVAFVAFFSALDLVWTVLAHQAGQMRELNPLGMKMIEDPVQLIAFKVIATVVSCGILFGLRHYHIARLASWWSCLACTILTFRWLTFNSMFLGS